MGVNDQQLVLVELDLDRPLRMEDRDPGAAVVEEEILEVPQDALEHRPLDPIAGDLDGGAAVAVARFEDDVDRVAERFEEAEEGLEEILARDGTDQRRQLGPGGGIDVGVEAISGLRHDVELPAGPDGVGEGEAAVTTAGEMGLERRAVGGRHIGDGRGTAAGLGGGEVVVEKAHDGGAEEKCGDGRTVRDYPRRFAQT